MGFVEHVRAPEGSPLLAQQLLLDPLQQFLAHGCHLARATDVLLSEGRTKFEPLEPFRSYEVPSMWPISHQVAGVVVLREQAVR